MIEEEIKEFLVDVMASVIASRESAIFAEIEKLKSITSLHESALLKLTLERVGQCHKVND